MLNRLQQEWLTLTLVPGVGTALFIRLLSRFGTPGEVLLASEAALRDVVGPKLAQRIRQYKGAVDVDAQMRAMEKYGAHLITLDDPAYPPHLAEIYDPPLVLFVRGEVHEADQQGVALVGTRNPTPYGVRMAEQFSRGLGERGVTVVSGLASGVDAFAHQGAMAGGGRTIAVLGCGVDIVYPQENDALMHEVMRHGAVISCFPMGVKPSKGHFPYRNRIISGMCLGTMVIEAPPKSGSLITARWAAEQGREVFALPGNVGHPNSMGPHSLIREGAKLVETVDDILVELELPVSIRQAAPARHEWRSAVDAPKPAAPKLPVSEQEKDVLSSLSPEGSFVDEVALACRIPVSEALSNLTLLELKGLVRQFSGKRFAPA